MRADLLRAISHDLRTPLTTIFGSSSTMMENYEMLPKEQKLAMLGGIKDDADGLIRMVENLLSITKIDNSNVELIKSEVVLEELVDAVIEYFNAPAKWFATSDTHFGAERTLELSRRPFRNVGEMDLTLISNWNKGFYCL